MIVHYNAKAKKDSVQGAHQVAGGAACGQRATATKTVFVTGSAEFVTCKKCPIE